MYRVRLQANKGQPYVYLPRSLVEELGWNKGDDLAVEEVIVEARHGNTELRGILIYKPETHT